MRVVFSPLLALVSDKAIEHCLAQNRLGQWVSRKSFNRLAQVLRQHLDVHFTDLLVGVVVHVLAVRCARVHAFADTLKTGRQHHCRTEIRVAGNIGGPTLNATALRRNTQHIGAVIVAVAYEDRRPGRTRHTAFTNQALIAVHRGCDDGTDRLGVLHNTRDEVVSHLGNTTAVRIISVSRVEQILAGFDVR